MLARGFPRVVLLLPLAEARLLRDELDMEVTSGEAISTLAGVGAAALVSSRI